MDTARRSGRQAAVVAGLSAGLAIGRHVTVLGWRQRPEESIGDDVAHARPEARVEALVEKLQRFADRYLPTTPFKTLQVVCMWVIVGTLLKSAR